MGVGDIGELMENLVGGFNFVWFGTTKTEKVQRVSKFMIVVLQMKNYSTLSWSFKKLFKLYYIYIHLYFIFNLKIKRTT